MVIFMKFPRVIAAVAASVAAAPAVAENDWRANYSMFGTPGLVDMPSAASPPDGEIAATLSAFNTMGRATFAFQAFPRVTGVFRYSRIYSYDRSFDIQYQVTDEGQYVPALAVGLRDMLGTGLFGSEYFVATKTLGPNVRATAGLGWGRLGSFNGFTNPLGIIDERLETRPNSRASTGGTVLTGQLFRGDAAFFGGVEWRINEDWTILAEYSSDAYEIEEARTSFTHRSPLNFGLTYRPRPNFQVGAYYLYGTDIGLAATFTVDPKTSPFPSGLDTAPLPVAVRGANLMSAQSWSTPDVQAAGVGQLGTAMGVLGFRLIGAEITASTMRVRYENSQFRAEAQGVGRVARILTQLAPANVDTFILEPTQRGIALSAITLRRVDLEAFENEPNASALSYDRAEFSDAAGLAPAIEYDDPTPALLWGVSPYLELSVFDGNKPVRGDVGIEASFQYELRPNVVLAGAYRQRLAGNRDETGSISASTLPPVRREVSKYGAESGGGVENLTLSWYGRPGRDFYSRVSIGYLERMFGGASGELLWKPVESQLALGAEINYAVQRDFDLGFGFQDYDVVTGHVSAYYDLNNGFEAQVDIGRYLAGDWGATFHLEREFENGWKVGGYFSLTDVSFEDFGEGSFDKGFRIEIPSDWLFGNPTRNLTATSLSSLSRDGGARVRIDGRLYDVVEGGHQGMMEENWGRFWR
jgi:hypothetical protein